MLVFIGFSVIWAFLILLEKKVYSRPVLIVLMAVIFLAIIDYLLFILGLKDSYLISDELVYYGLGDGLDDLAINDRYLWIKLNQNINFGIDAPQFFHKILPVISLPLFVIGLCKILGSRKALLFFASFPFVLHIFALNIRDMLVFAICIYSIACFYDKDNGKRVINWIFIMALLSLLLVLRPFFLLLVIASIFISYFVKSFERVKLTKALMVAFLAFVILAVGYSIGLIELFDRYYNRINYTMEFGIETLDGDVIYFTWRYALESIVRFFFAPLPTSLMLGYLNDGVSEWGIVHDITRLFSQAALSSLFIFCLASILIKKRAFKRAFGLVITNPLLCAVFTFGVSSSVIYAVYFGGGGHSRTKVLVYLMVYIYAILILESWNNSGERDADGESS